MLKLTQTIGGSSSGGADVLLSRTTLDGLAANGNDEGGNDDLKSRRLELRLGYGFSAFGDRFTWTPEVGVGLSDTGRDYSLGWRLVRGRSGGDGGAGTLFRGEAARERQRQRGPGAHDRVQTGSPVLMGPGRARKRAPAAMEETGEGARAWLYLRRVEDYRATHDGEDVVDGLGPFEGFGVFVVLFGEGADIDHELMGRGVHAALATACASVRRTSVRLD